MNMGQNPNTFKNQQGENIMKKRILSILALMLVLIMVLTSCEGLLGGGQNPPVDDPKDDPQANIAELVDTINGAGSIEEILDEAVKSAEDAELPTVEDILAILDEISFEADAKISGSLIGETALEGSAKINNRVMYLDIPNNGDGYIFFEDDLTMVSVHEGEAVVETSLKDAFAQLSEGTTEEVDIKELLQEQFGTQLVDMFYDYQLPEITADDIEHKDGRYLLKHSYIEKVADSVVNAFADYSKAQGNVVSDDEIKEVQDQVKEIVAGFNPTIGFLMENEEIIGVYVKVDPDEKDLEDYLGDMDELFLEAELGKYGAFVKFAFVNEYNNYKGELDLDLTYDEDDVLTKADLAVDFETDVSDSAYDEEYIYNEEYGYGYHETYARYDIEKHIELSLDMTLDLTAVDNGGKVLDLAFTFENKALSAEKYDYETGEKVTLTAEEQAEYLTNNKTSATASADWTATKNGTSALVMDVKVTNGSETETLKVELNLKHSSDMTAPKDVVDAKDAAIAENNSAK